jgi:4-hydroxybenzoate polyprenyltransferase
MNPESISSKLRLIVEAMRLPQWIKNLACFAGLVFSGRLFLPAMQFRAALAFATFSLAASAVYLFNDVVDRRNDAVNPRTAKRPIASGRLSVRDATLTIVVLVITSLVGAWYLSQKCAAVAVTYIILNVGYSLRVKQTVIADVLCIAVGFILRVVYGVYAVEVLPSVWIVLCMLFLALFLGFGKRRGELDALQSDAEFARPVLRKYTLRFLDLCIGLSAALTITTYSLYCALSNHSPLLILTVLPVVYCVLRYAHQILVEGRGQSPERLLYSDRMLWIGITTWGIIAVGALYGRFSWTIFAPR